ncbi:MAG: 1-acyl-sn-glycerol-3-phosphate acyltransferase, partial [Flavobacteriaceae bacterium]|nr:1-acyl-sn-glycerol-3-phosphate acyltransferase [Flavobacteriaceae bacterium]
MKLAFDEIRPYREPDEIAEAIQRILDDETFYGFAEQMFAGGTLQKMRSKLKEIKTVKEFQQEIIAKLVKKLIDETSQGFTITGLEDLDKNKSYLFISNHRDIIMDSALLC